MKFNFKKIASVLATTIMLGSTVGFAAAAWPDPFVKSGTADAALVYGAAAAQTDMAAATDLGAELDKSVTVATSGTTSGTGDISGVDTSARRIYYADDISAAKTTLSASDMPTVLADGKVTDLSGVEYKYTQTITLGDTNTTFGTSGGDLKDPTLYLDVGTSASVPVYSYGSTFTKNLNVSDSTNVQGQKIKILGVDYVIGASSNAAASTPVLYLYGAGETVAMDGAGTSKTVTIAGKEHTVDFVGATATNTAKIAVDGVSKSVTKGSSYTFSGDVTVYVKDVTYQAYAGGLQSAELIIGANTLLIQNGTTIKQGAEQNSIQGTNGLLSVSGGLLTGITVQVAAKKTQTDSIVIGGSMTDPVFGGLKVQFVSANPVLTDATRAKIKVETDNNQYAYVTFTSARAGDKGEQRLTFTVDNNTASNAIQPLLAHQTLASNKGYIHVLEGENAATNDWIVVNQGDTGTILNVDDISVNSVSEATATFSDVITGDSQKVTLSNSSGGQFTRSGVSFFGGTGYYIAANAAGTAVNISWSSSGTATLFPRIKLKDGGWIALLTETNIGSLGSLILPDGQTTLATSGTTVPKSTTAADSGIVWGNFTVMASGLNWTIRNATATSSNMVVYGITQNSSALSTSCSFNSTKGPAILYIEPKKWNDGSFGNYICVPMTTTGSTEIAIGDPVFNGTNSGFVTYDSDTYKKAAVDQYGAFVTKEDRTNENGVATILAPLSQMYFDIKFTSEAITQGASKIKVVTDAEVSSVSGNNLIVVGGACINKAAAMIVNGNTDAMCGDAWAAKTGAGAGKYLIQVVASPYNAQKVAMLIAGYEAAETTQAEAKVKEGTTVTTVGTKTIGPTAA